MSRSKLVIELVLLLDDKEITIDDDGSLMVYNDRLEHWEIFDDLKDILNSAIHHRTFQECI